MDSFFTSIIVSKSQYFLLHRSEFPNTQTEERPGYGYIMNLTIWLRANIKKLVFLVFVYGIAAVFLPSSSNALSNNPLSDADFLDFKEKNTASDFLLNDLDDTPTGLDSFRGRVVLLYFWTTWWVWCRKEVSSLIKLYDEFKSEGFVVIGIDAREDKEIVRVHPEHYLINRRGELIGKALGPRNWMKRQNIDLIRFFLDQDWRLRETIYAFPP